MYKDCHKEITTTWYPCGIQSVWLEGVRGDVVQWHPDPVHPGAQVRGGHQEHRERDQAQDNLDDQHRNTDALEVLLRWNHSHQFLEQTQIIC